MRLCYPCISRSIGCISNSTFRLAPYSEESMESTTANNLSRLERIFGYNRDNGFFFFRLSSDIVPFASHPRCTYDWKGWIRASCSKSKIKKERHEGARNTKRGKNKHHFFMNSAYSIYRAESPTKI
ncbi:MAG: hypothetical protein AB1295_04300 [Candidatus Micrarchaeota archaeon]